MCYVPRRRGDASVYTYDQAIGGLTVCMYMYTDEQTGTRERDPVRRLEVLAAEI